MGKQSHTTSTVYGNTTTSNPYATATTNNSGTYATLKDGTALNSIYNFVNKNIDSLLDEYLNPTLNSTTNQAKINSYVNTMNSKTHQDLENNIINPLSNRNMIRSSQATDLYKNLSNTNVNAFATFLNDLLSKSQSETGNVLTNLMSQYQKGYNVISDMQKQSLNTSKGNATTSTNYNSASNGTNVAGDVLSMISSLVSMFGNSGGTL